MASSSGKITFWGGWPHIKKGIFFCGIQLWSVGPTEKWAFSSVGFNFGRLAPQKKGYFLLWDSTITPLQFCCRGAIYFMNLFYSPYSNCAELPENISIPDSGRKLLWSGDGSLVISGIENSGIRILTLQSFQY